MSPVEPGVIIGACAHRRHFGVKSKIGDFYLKLFKAKVRGTLTSGWSLARLDQVRFVPNSHVGISYVAEVTNRNLDT